MSSFRGAFCTLLLLPAAASAGPWAPGGKLEHQTRRVVACSFLSLWDTSYLVDDTTNEAVQTAFEWLGIPRGPIDPLDLQVRSLPRRVVVALVGDNVSKEGCDELWAPAWTAIQDRLLEGNEVEFSYAPGIGTGFGVGFGPTLSISTSDPTLRVAVGGQLLTPIGTFAANVQRDRNHHLRIAIGDEHWDYRLEPERHNVVLSLPAGSRLESNYDGRGNLQITIPANSGVRLSPDA